MKTKIYEDLAKFFLLWRETILGKKGGEKKEVKFITDIFKKYPGKIKTVIDLGGGIGLQGGSLSKLGYDVTNFDRSKKARAIAKKNYPQLKIIKGSFENIKIKKKYDAAICMWSTLSYIFSEKGRINFYNWQKTHIKKLIILDQANFYIYPKKFHKVYFGENERYKMKVIRDFKTGERNIKKTKYIYEIFDKTTNKNKIIRDAEKEDFVAIERLEKYLGPKWKLQYLYGDYDLKHLYDKKKSFRMISVFFRKK